ncbi:MAG: LysM peptidoglycan-binding domain-containing protein [Gemmatimonadetes bacterium]|nr:LysM peptidoglycan-binding domain-containing protein [Gemmatimonadota bacterium]
MARLKVVLAALVILPSFVAGQQSPLNHTVVRGETLWGLAQRYYQDPFLWPRIWEANRNAVVDPHVILPTQVLVIPGMEGAAVIGAVDVRPGERPGMGNARA